jgi:hypothetical protein
MAVIHYMNIEYWIQLFLIIISWHSLSFGFATKARAYKGVSQEWSSGVTFHAFRSVGECEGMNPHTPKWAPTLRVGVLMEFQIFRGRFQGSQLNWLKPFLYHWKALETHMSKMGLHDPFGYLKHKLWPKEGSGIKLPIWLSATKSWESP